MSTSNVLQPIRGTHDLIGKDWYRHHYIEEAAQNAALLYGYEPIATPIFEHTTVFKRTLGEATDIVGKEMYTFIDRGGEEITLRPEGTAPVVRAIISNGLTQNLPLRFMYSGPMFRYERPQKGRVRQLHQFGIELIGVPDPLADVEIIALAAQIFDQLGLRSRLVLELNTLGDQESRLSYRKALVEYFSKYRADLSQDSQIRLERNPLRILDSKDPKDKELIAAAPLFSQFLNPASQQFFDKVQEGLSALSISFNHNPHLVRGLDYYCHTAFEFTTNELGSQSAVLAGGRYDGLISQMGGPDIPGAGWALGIDRLALMLEDVFQSSRPISIVPIGEEMQNMAFKLAVDLRAQGIPTSFSYSGNVGKRLKYANKVNAHLAVLLGSDEIAAGVATVRNLDSGEQTTVALSALSDYLKNMS